MLARVTFFSLLAVFGLCAQSGRGGGGGFAGPSSTLAGRGSGPMQAHDCAASGTVVNAITGEPVPRAMVSMSGGEGSGAAADAMGNWSMTNIICGARLPVATHAGFVSGNQSNPAADGRKRMIDLVSGSPVTNVKVPLMPGGSIAGTVRDTNGDPIESAVVRLLRVRVAAGERTVTGQGNASSDAEGNFRFDSLDAARYVVCADSRQPVYPVGGGEVMPYREQCFPGPEESAISIAMRVEPGRESRASFTLSPFRGARVRGSVSGAPPRATAVQLISISSGGPIGNKFGQVAPDGTFDIPSVRPGTYVARATVNGAQTNNSPVAQATVVVGDGDVDNLTLTFQSGATVSGVVRYELSNTSHASSPNANANANANANPPAIPGINVALVPAVPRMPSFGPLPQVQWDANHASFSFAGVVSGQFRLVATTNVPGAYAKSATLHGQDVTRQGFSVDGPVGPIEIVVSDAAGSVDAMVNDADGHPIAASVILLSTTGLRRIFASGEDGHATVKNVPAGDYRAWAFDDVNSVPYAEDEWMAQNAGPGEKVSVTNAASASITLKRLVAPPQ